MINEQVTAQAILAEWRKLQGIRKRSEYDWRFWLLGEAKHQAHYDQYGHLKSMVQRNQDALYDLVFSGEITNWKELHSLIFFGGHGGSVSKADNLHWASFVARVRERSNELPEEIQSSLAWLHRVHGY